MRISTLCICIVLSTGLSCSQDQKNDVAIPSSFPFEPVLYVPDDGIIWGMDMHGSKDLFFTEKKGNLYRFNNGQKTAIENVPQIYQKGQGGLLDVALHPNFEDNQYLYLTYATSEGGGDGGNTAVMRGKLMGNTLDSVKVLYKAEPNTSKGQHFGSRILFDPKGYLYFSIGDRGNRDENPQDITRDCGKIYRLHDDGRIPDDNPFVGVDDAKKAIYSYGHRNPQGLALHPETQKIWEHEHGPRGGDEINIIVPKKNYGWPEITYGINYSGTSITDSTAKPGMEQPLHYWIPSIAPSGMTFISSDTYGEAYKGSLLIGSLAFQYLERLILNNNKVVKREKLMDTMGRVRDILEAPDGMIYVSVEGKGIYKLIPKK